MDRLETLCKGQAVDPHGCQNEEMKDLMRGADYVELAWGEALRGSSLQLSRQSTRPANQQSQKSAYRVDKSSQRIQRQLNQVPLHAHVLKHVM